MYAHNVTAQHGYGNLRKGQMKCLSLTEKQKGFFFFVTVVFKIGFWNFTFVFITLVEYIHGCDDLETLCERIKIQKTRLLIWKALPKIKLYFSKTSNNLI